MWVTVQPRQKFWHHVDAELWPSLTDGGGKAGASTATMKQRTLLGRWRRPSLVHVMNRLRRAPTVTVPDVEHRRGSAAVAVMANGSREDLVALSPQEGRAVRFGKPGSYNAEYLDLRRRFERYLPAPGFSVDEDGAVLIEDWCEGPLLSQLPVEQRLRHALALLDGYASLVAGEAVARPESSWQRLPAYLDEVELPTWLREPLSDRRVRRLLASPLMAPAQGDAGVGNVIFDVRDQSPRFIDFGGAKWSPIWRDPVQLALSTAHDLRDDADASQALAAALDRIWAAAGLDEVVGLGYQHWAALFGVGRAWPKAIRVARNGGTERRPDSRDFVNRVTQTAGKHLAPNPR